MRGKEAAFGAQAVPAETQNVVAGVSAQKAGDGYPGKTCMIVRDMAIYDYCCFTVSDRYTKVTFPPNLDQ